MSYPNHKTFTEDYKNRITVHLNHGFEDMNGNKWCNAWVDSYNLLSDKIKKWMSHDETREFYLDQRHKLFVLHMDICRQDKNKLA